jgi:hypothetical protein
MAEQRALWLGVRELLAGLAPETRARLDPQRVEHHLRDEGPPPPWSCSTRPPGGCSATATTVWRRRGSGDGRRWPGSFTGARERTRAWERGIDPAEARRRILLAGGRQARS